MAYIIPASAETLADQLLYTRGRLVDVGCHACAATVQVRKNSSHHTSIQWNQQAQHACAAFAEMEQGEGRELHAPCPRLQASIDEAVRIGALPVGAAGADGVSDE